MKDIDLAIIVFSDLNSSSGGVETWLNLFLEEINLNRDQYNNGTIHIYHYERAYLKNPVGADLDFVKLHPLKIDMEVKGLLGNLITLYKFHSFAIKHLKANQEVIPFTISIGSYPSGIFDWVILKLLCFRKKTKHIIWLRTTLKKYIKTHQSRIFSRSILWLEQKALKDADIIISNGWDTRVNYLEDYNINSVVIPNAIKLERYQNSKSLSALSEPVKIAFIGRFFENKGIFNFVEAIRIFNISYPDLIDRVKFVFIGWGEESVETFASETKNCDFIGKVANEKMLTYLDDIFCGVALTKFSDDEAGGSGVSNALLELMGSGRAIIAYDNPIFRQFPDADFMIYSPENDDAELAANFAKLVLNKDMYIVNGTKAREYSQSFSISSHVNSFFKLLNENMK
ncbi:glycosyltransferase involved in cell wall biosynthesis [Pedobacter cryoconitis]|uniref:Glycosyltransferase involved in cell wall biosynthesis n=1 Tax=Pedobacter cryoconitis TaxID=188932 RepID=A0A7W8ZMD4_9SPHI|nr:glycosyltransferase [Pedobacter cryoconitis]MBB5636590.1 glycosyltransferase involved in cell wall biosynthesis [Pedobacter cryoconitis]